MTEIYLIRHAQAEGNLYRMMQGHWDGSVTALGLKQIDALAKRFRTVHVDALYASDLYRTRLTASAITRYHDLPMQLRPALREINVGSWEARFFGDVAYEQPEAMHDFIFDPEKWQAPGAETYAEVGQRAYAELIRIAEANDGKSVVVVSHGVTILCLLSRILGIGLGDKEHLPICGNTGVTLLHFESGAFSPVFINDVSHLSALGMKPWQKTPDMRGESFDPREDVEYYKHCYSDAWLAAHGNLNGYSAEPYYAAAVRHYEHDHAAVIKIYDKDKPAGLIDLDTERGAHAGYGWISLLYLAPEYRGIGCGIQLLGRAIVHYEALGRRALRLHVADDNAAALAFYRRYGFDELSSEPGSSGRLLLMEKKIGGRNV